jgi:hypothetical protein
MPLIQMPPEPCLKTLIWIIDNWHLIFSKIEPSFHVFMKLSFLERRFFSPFLPSSTLLVLS